MIEGGTWCGSLYGNSDADSDNRDRRGLRARSRQGEICLDAIAAPPDDVEYEVAYYVDGVDGKDKDKLTSSADILLAPSGFVIPEGFEVHPSDDLLPENAEKIEDEKI